MLGGNILKPIVLIGTFALAMAFAANDLVNFIGVPMAGYHAYQAAAATDAPLAVTMDALGEKVPTETHLLLLAGAIMAVTLWVSRKARTVTETEISLGQQEEGLERFESTLLSRGVVRMAISLMEAFRRMTPAPLREMAARRLDTSALPSGGRRGSAPFVRHAPRVGQPDGRQCRDLLRHRPTSFRCRLPTSRSWWPWAPRLPTRPGGARVPSIESPAC